MSTGPQESFIRTYSTLLLAVWRDRDERARLLADPTRYAAEAGLPVAPGARVEVDTGPQQTPLAGQDILAAWNGTPGLHVLRVPAAPAPDRGELTDQQLRSVAAGLLCVIEIY